MVEHTIPVYIFLFPFTGALIVPLFFKNKSLCAMVAQFTLLGSLLFSIFSLILVKSGAVMTHHFGGWTPPFGIEWRLDALSSLMCVLISAVGLIVVYGTRNNVHSQLKSGIIPFYTTVLLNTSGLFGILLTHDLFNLFVFLEVSSLTTYALIATGDRRRGNLASFRYLLIGTAGAAIYLLGVGYLYAITGSLNISDIAARIQELQLEGNKALFIGLLLIFIGIAIKMGLFPFHGWLPDAYTYASNSASSLIAPLATKTSIYVFIRIFYEIIGADRMEAMGVHTLLVVLGSIAIVYGSVHAFLQTNFKRMLAFSSISHIGLIVVGIGVNHTYAFIGAILHIVNHAVMKAALFLISTSAHEKYGVEDIFEMSKLRGKMPHTMRAIALCALSMVGIPPLCGFFSKWYILVGAIEANQYLVALLIVFSSLLTALYFFKLLEKVFYQKKEDDKQLNENCGERLVLSYEFLSIALIVLGIYAPSIFNWGLKVLAPMVN